MIAAILKHTKNGIIYIFTLPVLLIALAVFAVIGVFEFLILGTKAIFYFFTGRNLFGEYPEDIEARKILAELNAPATPSEQKVEANEESKESNQPMDGFFVSAPINENQQYFGLNDEQKVETEESSNLEEDNFL